MKLVFTLGVGFLVAYVIFNFLETERLKSEILKLQSKIEKVEVFRKKPFFKFDKPNLYWEIYDLKNRAEILEFCSQCPLYQEKAQEDMKQKSQAEQE